jgi:hypothetical protein
MPSSTFKSPALRTITPVTLSPSSFNLSAPSGFAGRAVGPARRRPPHWPVTLALPSRATGRGPQRRTRPCAPIGSRELRPKDPDRGARAECATLRGGGKFRKNGAPRPAQRGSYLLGALALQVKKHDGPPIALWRAPQLVIEDTSKIASACVVVSVRSREIDHQSLPRALPNVCGANLAGDPIRISVRFSSFGCSTIWQQIANNTAQAGKHRESRSIARLVPL